jgi:DNA polymerase elongation subunit (family B)/predicted RNA-binding Zn-ribbon protein involved in translation (DUF1610 family)
MSKPKAVLEPREPRILLFDIETGPDAKEVLKVFTSLGNWPGRTFKASIQSILCVGWKVLGESKTHCINAWDFPTRWNKNVNDDYQVCKAAYEVLKNADVVITHNGKKFDWKFMQTRLLKHGFPQLPKILHVDTCQEARKNFLMYSNKLNDLGKFLGVGEKLEHEGWDLWCNVLERKPESQRKMTAYCKMDVILLERVFEKLRPIIKSLPNYNIFNGSDHSCPNCGSQKLQKRGERVQKQKRTQRYQCQDCGSWSSAGTKYPIGETQ